MLANVSLENFFLTTTVEAATEAARTGNGPFAAAVLLPSGEVFRAVNQVTELNDPTAHAEVQAIRKAAKVHGFDLTGALLFSSCEPCPMCLTAIMWARISETIWAASSAQAAAAGFDDSEFYRSVSQGLPPSQARRGGMDAILANTPFEAWTANSEHIAY